MYSGDDILKTVYVNIDDDINKRKARRIAKKLYKINRKEDIVIALSKNLMKNEILNANIEEFGLKKLDGKWLFKFLLSNIIEYVCKVKGKVPETQNVAILINSKDDIVIGQISEIAKKVKTLKIISNHVNDFDYLEEELYFEYGIAMQITNNKRKSLLNTDIIINFDYSEEELNEYYIKAEGIIINLQGKITLKNFSGINIDDYEIDYEKGNFEEFTEENDYEKNIIYESYIYRRDTLLNIQNQLKRDNVRLVGLIQDNGKYYLKSS